MATLTEDQYRALIVAELGNLQIVKTNINTYWQLAADAATLNERYLRAKRAALDLVLGLAASQVSFKALDGASVSLSDMFDHWMALRELIQGQLDVGAAQAQGGGLVGEMTKTAPIMAPPGAPNPNAQAYRGDVFALWWRRR